MPDAEGSGPGVIDGARLRRLQWRARRGLLENDLVLARFFERHCDSLGEQDVQGLDCLLELTDNELLDLILGRTEPEGAAAEPHARRVLGWLRAA